MSTENKGPYMIKHLKLLPGQFFVTLEDGALVFDDSFDEGQALRIRNALNAAYLSGQASRAEGEKSILPVFSEEEIERICKLLSSGLVHDGRTKITIDNIRAVVAVSVGNALRHANSKAVSVDRLVEVTKDTFIKHGFDFIQEYDTPTFIDLRSRLKSLTQ